MKKLPNASKIVKRILFGSIFLIIGSAITFPITQYFIKNNVESRFVSVWNIFEQSKFYQENYKNWTPRQVDSIKKQYSPDNFVKLNSADHKKWIDAFASITTLPSTPEVTPSKI